MTTTTVQNRNDNRAHVLMGPALGSRFGSKGFQTVSATPQAGIKGYAQNASKNASAPLMRSEIGDVLRTLRQNQHRTLRDVSSQAQVSLGYLSEVERGQKEASSELLEAITGALRVPLWYVLREVSDRMALIDGAQIPDTVPDDLIGMDLVG